MTKNKSQVLRHFLTFQDIKYFDKRGKICIYRHQWSVKNVKETLKVRIWQWVQRKIFLHLQVKIIFFYKLHYLLIVRYMWMKRLSVWVWIFHKFQLTFPIANVVCTVRLQCVNIRFEYFHILTYLGRNG